MSRQSHSKKNVTTILFLFVIASIGFPFSSFTDSYGIPTNVTFSSDYQIVNFFLGNGFVGKSIFDSSTYTTQSLAYASSHLNGTEPVITLIGNSTIYLSVGDGYTELGATANDPSEGDLTSSIVISSQFIDRAGEYEILYLVNNTEQTYGIAVRNVVVTDDTVFIPQPPTLPPTPDPEPEPEPENIYPTLTRMETYEVTQLTDTRHITKLGMPPHIQNNEGEWVADIYNEDDDTFQIESAKISYSFSKSACAMSMFDVGRITNSSVPIIKSNNWVTKVALNGTDVWTDVSQNSLPCTVTTTISGNSIILNSTKSDSLGTMSEIYHYSTYQGMKESVYFTNNDPALNNHKFSFSNIIRDVPPSLLFLTSDPVNVTKTNMYSHYQPQFQPVLFGGDATVINTNVQSTIQLNRTDFLFNDNGTNVQINDRFAWIQLKEIEGKSSYRIWEYTFSDEDDFEKLWSIKFVTNTDFTMDTFIDFANVTETLPVGNTTSIDPTLNSFESFIRMGLGSNTVNCNRSTGGFSESTAFGMSISSGSSIQKSCSFPMITFDISSIPADATPIRGTLTMNQISSSCTPTSAQETQQLLSWCNPVNLFYNSWYDCSGEDLRFLPLIDKITAFFKSDLCKATGLTQGATSGTINGALFTTGKVHDNGFSTANPHHVTGQQSQTQTNELFDPFLIKFEETLESIPRDNRYQLGLSVAGVGTDTDGFGLGLVYNTVQRQGSASSVWNVTGSFLEVVWDLFLVPEEPQNFTCVSNPTFVFLDWTSVLVDGGRPVIEYVIERDDGFGFNPLVTVGLFPTDFSDFTAIVGIGHIYRIAGVNGEGTGAFNEFAGNCGVASSSSPPLTLIATNIGVGIVQLNWTPPFFDGNDPITGYKIERTTGTPQGVTNEWTFIQHKQQGGDTVSQGEYRILNIGDSTGFLRVQGASDTTVEGIIMSSNINSGGLGNTYLFRSFITEEIKNHNVSWRWDQFKKAAGFSLQTFGEWETKAYVVDGVFDMEGANQVGGSGDFPASASGTGNAGIHIPSVGNGVLTDCFNLNNAVVLLGGNPVQATLPALAQMESTNQHEVSCNIGDLSQSTQPQVTIVFMIRDQQSSLIGCGSNCASHEIGAIVMDFIDIDGIGNWVFTNDLPDDTDINFDSVSTTLNVFGNTVTNDFTLGDGFIVLEEDTGTPATTFDDDTVEEITFYGYRVSGVNGAGAGTPSDVEVIQTSGSPETPVITVIPTSTTSIFVDWETPELNLSTVIEYELKRKLGVTGIFQFLDTTVDTQFEDGLGLFTLQVDTEYCYAVKLITNVGDTPFSVEQCATTFSPPDAVENLTVTALDGSSVNMSFEDPLSDGGSPITGFQIEQKLGAGAFDIVQQPDQFNQIRNDTALPIGTLITYRVTAFNQFGASNTASASDTTDATPQVPPNFTCSASSSTSITLSWNTPVTFSAPTGYQIDGRSVGGVFSTIIANTASTDTFFVSGGLPFETTVEFRILAITPEGNTDFTPTIRCATLGAPDFPPEDLQGDFTQTIPHQMVLAWDIPETFGIPIIEFRIERNDGAGYNEIATVSGSTFLFVDIDPANIVAQKYRVFTVGTEGDSAPSIAVPFSANQTSHWNYENTIDDTGGNKNVGAITGTVNFNNTGQVGLGHTFGGGTFITVADESDYDTDLTPFGITTYYKGSGFSANLTWNFIKHDLTTDNLGTVTLSASGLFIPSNTATTANGHNYLFKVFDKSDLVNNSVRIKWTQTTVGSGGDFIGSRWYIADGAMDLVGANVVSSGGIFEANVGGTQAGYHIPPTGNGIVVDCMAGVSGATLTGTFFPPAHRQGGGSLDETCSIGDLSGASESQVTVVFLMSDNLANSNGRGSITVDEIDISGVGSWDWNTGSTLTGNVGNINAVGTTDASAGSAGTQALVTKATSLTSIGYKLFIDSSGVVGVKFTNTDTTNEISILGNTFVQDDTLHFIGFGYNGNQTANGVSLMVDGSFETKNVLVDNLSGSILNDEPLVIGATSSGASGLKALLDDTRFFGSGTLDDATLLAVAEDSIDTVIPIVATITIAGTTFADISREQPLIFMTSGYPLPTINTINLFNFTITNVNSQTVGLVIDGVSGEFILDPSMFNIMSSLSNYTAVGSLTNSEETFPLLSNFDLQTPIFTFTGDFFFQQQRNDDFSILSFNYTQTQIPFDLSCNFKSTLFGNGTTVNFDGVFFVEHLQPVSQLEDVVVACIDQNTIVVDPSAPSFGGINTILSFVSFGDTTGVGNFLQFTNNYGDFFGIGLPFLFIIILAAAFTGRSAPTGILIIGVAIGIMSAIGILEVDPFMWGIILVLIILGVLGGKKFL